MRRRKADSLLNVEECLERLSVVASNSGTVSQVSLDQWVTLPYALSVPEGFRLRRPLNPSSIASQDKPLLRTGAWQQSTRARRVLASLSGRPRWVLAVGASQTVRGTLHTVVQKKPSTLRAQRGSAGRWAPDGVSPTSGGSGTHRRRSLLNQDVKPVAGDG